MTKEELGKAEVALVRAIAKAFRPFISIEDNQEQGMAQKATEQQCSNQQDSDWFERGELPPAGEFVDVEGEDLVYGSGEMNCEVLAHVEDTAVIRMSYGLGCFQSRVLSPSRTEREQLTSIIDGGKRVLAAPEAIADAILAAGFSLRDK